MHSFCNPRSWSRFRPRSLLLLPLPLHQNGLRSSASALVSSMLVPAEGSGRGGADDEPTVIRVHLDLAGTFAKLLA